MQVHEREQREGLGDRAHRVLRQQRGESDGLVAQLAADRLLRVRGEIALVEQQVEHGMHAGQPRPQRVERRRLDVEGRLAQPVARARQALVDVRLGGEEPQRDLRGAESAQRLQCEDQLRFPRNGVVAADEEHAQHVVRHLAGEELRRRRVAALQHQRRRRAPGCGADRPSAAGSPIRLLEATRYSQAPGIVGKALRRPGRERSQERTLDRVLHEVEMAHADLARQQRHQPAVFVPEEMFHQARRGGRA